MPSTGKVAIALAIAYSATFPLPYASPARSPLISPGQLAAARIIGAAATPAAAFRCLPKKMSITVSPPRMADTITCR
jgi:hypothetical protein